MITVTGTLTCEEHGEFEVERDIEPSLPLFGEQVDISGECPECGDECFGSAPIRRW